MSTITANLENLPTELTSSLLAALLPRFDALEKLVERLVLQTTMPSPPDLEAKVVVAIMAALEPRLHALEEAVAKSLQPVPSAAAVASDIPDVPSAGPFKYFVNRGKHSFDAAFRAIAGEHPQYNSNMALFTYFDTYGGKQLPTFTGYQRTIQLIERSVTNDFDNKKVFAHKLQDSGCEPAFAPTYFEKEEALRATDGCDDALFFIKSAHGTAGKGMRVVTREELRTFSMAQSHVIQRAIQDLSLIDDRKFVVRFYLLIHDKAVFAHRRAIAIVHGPKYNRNSTDYNVQICHNTEAADTGVHCCELNTFPQGDTWHRSIAQRVLEILPALQPLLDRSSADRYTIIGMDALIDNMEKAWLIEANLYPNLWSLDELTNQQVKVPVLRDVIAKTVLGISSPELETVDVAALGRQ